MEIRIASATPWSSRKGNRVTAARWAGLFRHLGHEVHVEPAYSGGPAHLLVALHAMKSAESIVRFRAEQPQGRVILALTGTDVYGPEADLDVSRRSMAAADWIVVLHDRGGEVVPARERARVRVIWQSAHPHRRVPPDPRVFEVGVIGHLRRVKDPLRAAFAARLLPESSRLRVVAVGGVLEEAVGEAARVEAARNPRFVFLGEHGHEETIALLARMRVLVMTSRAEGGPSALSEAIVSHVPVIATRIPAFEGLLGAEYPGLFRVGDTRGLARLLRRMEEDPECLAALEAACEALRPRFLPERELEAWARLLREVPRHGRR